jgi:hypothetical protein
MKYGNFLQLLAIITLIVLTAFEYRTSKKNTEAKLYQLRVQKSYINRNDYSHEYGPDYNNMIKKEIVNHTQLLQTHLDFMKYKIIAIMVLALISVFHFIRYFYVPYDTEHEELPMVKYDASTWFLNFVFFGIVSIWYAYFSNGYAGAIIGYILGLLCATKCLWHVSRVIQTLNIKKLTGIRVAEISIATLIYFHLIGFIIFYYGMMLAGLPAIINIMKGSKPFPSSLSSLVFC